MDDRPDSDYLRGSEAFDGSHGFLAEELLQPMVCMTDVARVNMFANQLAQALVPDAPERPRVFTRFENKFGSYTTAVRRLREGATVIGTFDRSPLERVVALRYDSGLVDVHFGAPARHLTEGYGYRLDNSLALGLREGDELEAGQVVQGWPCHDEEGNFMYGTNLRTVYMNLDGLTYEDGIVIGESAARKLAHTRVERLTVVVNSNDLLVNLYGDPDDPEGYRGFPEVGEDVRGGLLLARRRINHDSVLYELAAPQLRRVNWDSDAPFFAEGTVVGIEAFSNLTEAELDKHHFNRQILGHARRWDAFRQWFLNTFHPHVSAEDGDYTPSVAHWYRVCRDTQAAKWRHERQEFDGVVLRFTVARSCPAVPGSKISNRLYQQPRPGATPGCNPSNCWDTLRAA